MFDGSYKAKGKGISFRGKTAQEKDRSELKRRLKEKRKQRSRDKVRAKAALRIQKCYRAYICLKHRRAALRQSWDAEIEGKREVLLQRPTALAYMIGSLLFFFDDVDVADPDRLLGVTQLVLQSVDQTPSYLHLSTGAFEGSLWIGLVWRRQVVALVSLCVKCTMLGSIPLNVTKQLLSIFLTSEAWPTDLQRDAFAIASDLGIQLSLGGRRGEVARAQGNTWIHQYGATLFEATLHALNKAALEGTALDVNQPDGLAKNYLDTACQALVLCDQALAKEGGAGDMSNMVDQFVSTLGANGTVFKHKGVAAFLATCSKHAWRSCLEKCKEKVSALDEGTVGCLLANMLHFYVQRDESHPDVVADFWRFVGKALPLVPFNAFASGEGLKERAPMDAQDAKMERAKRRSRRRKNGRPVLRRRSRLVEVVFNSVDSSEVWQEQRRQVRKLKEQSFVRKEIYKALDMEDKCWEALVPVCNSLELIRARWDSQRESDHDSKDDLFIVRAVAFYNRSRPILRELWGLVLDKLNPQEELSAVESRLVAFTCATTVHLFQALDDEELFTKEWPFPMQQLRRMSQFVRDLLYKVVWLDNANRLALGRGRSARSNQEEEGVSETTSMLKSVAIELYSGLHERHIRHVIMPHAQWLFPPIPREELGLTDESGMEAEDEEAMSTDSDDTQSRGKRKSTKVITPEAASNRAKEVMRYLPQTISFEQRVNIFNHYLLSDRRGLGLNSLQERMGFAERIRLDVRRDSLFEDAFKGLGNRLDRLKRTISVTFYNNEGLKEAGIDGGGLFKEFITVFMKQAFSAEAGLFKTTEDNQLYPAPKSTSREKLERYRFIGAMMGKAVYEGILVAPRLAPFFLNILLKKTNTVHDLQSYDTEIYRNLLFVKTIENPETLDLNFVAPSTGESLGPNGSSRALTKDNRYEYITRLAHYLLNKQFAKEAAAFSVGFNALIPPSWIQIFSSRELQLVIGGSDSGYDVQDLRNHMTYSGGYHPSQPYVQGFWDILAEFTPQQKADFLHFITSCPRPPLSGFASLRPRINLHQVRISNDNEKLPSASTCVNMLKLPKYSSIAVLKEKLVFAISQGAGFELS